MPLNTNVHALLTLPLALPNRFLRFSVALFVALLLVVLENERLVLVLALLLHLVLVTDLAIGDGALCQHRRRQVQQMQQASAECQKRWKSAHEDRIHTD